MGKPKSEDAVRDLAEIRELLNAWDPYGLVDRGAPPDEYDSEGGVIYNVLTSGGAHSAEQLARHVARIFEESLGGGFTESSCMDVARGIWTWWQEREGQTGQG